MTDRPRPNTIVLAMLVGSAACGPANAEDQVWIRHFGAGPTAVDFCGGDAARLRPGELMAVNLNGDILVLGGQGGPNGQRRGWGSNGNGVYAWPPSSTPVEHCVDFPPADGPSRLYHTHLAFGPNHAAAVATGIFNGVFIASTVVCWGNNSHGQCDVPLETHGTLPGEIVEVACGSNHTLARNAAGQVRAWGSNQYGQSQVPAQLAQGPGSVVHISAGGGHSMARHADGSLTCWGAGSPGDAVDNFFRCGQSSPPPTLGAVLDMAAGGVHSVGLRVDGTVVCWGAGSTAQTWNYNMRQSMVPPDLGPCVRVSAGVFTTAALTASGTVCVWGYTGDLGYCSGQCDIAPGVGTISGFWPGFRGTTFLSDQPRPSCPADIVPSCNVDGADLGVMLASWGPSPSVPAADLSGDGAVDGVDLGMLLAAWGSCQD